jgi:hypothetical protein
MFTFKFKWTNQDATPHYRPPALAVGGSAGGNAQPNSNTGATARSGQAIGLPLARPATSVHRGGSIRGADSSAPYRPALEPV